jgi:hypothetical protein
MCDTEQSLADVRPKSVLGSTCTCTMHRFRSIFGIAQVTFSVCCQDPVCVFVSRGTSSQSHHMKSLYSSQVCILGPQHATRRQLASRLALKRGTRGGKGRKSEPTCRAQGGSQHEICRCRIEVDIFDRLLLCVAPLVPRHLLHRDFECL